MSGRSQGHPHSHVSPQSAAGRHRWRLLVAFGLVAAFFVVELVAGLASGSLSLVSDAGHMAADVVTLGAALVATRLAARPDTSGRRTFGFYRAEVFASGLAVLIMLGVAVSIGIEAVARGGNPEAPATGIMLAVGILGLVINLICLLLLRAGASESLNVKGAYLEVIADSLGSVGVIAAAVLVATTGWSWWDAIIALAIAVFVAARAIRLGREVLAVLGQEAPAGVEPVEILEALHEVPGVTDVHDLHVWQLTSGMDVATAHLVVDGVDAQTALAAAAAVLRERFGIDHATVQVEAVGAGECHGSDW